jgi:hypothetical protein
MKDKLCLVAAIVGGLLFVLSLLWGFVFPAERAWTQEKSSRMSALSSRAHTLHVKVKLGERNPAAFGDEEPGQVRKEYKDVTEELASLKQDFQSAQRAPKTMAGVLRWSGLIVGIAGLLGLQFLKSG